MANGFLLPDHRPHLHKHTKRTVSIITARGQIPEATFNPFHWLRAERHSAGISHLKCLHTAQRKGVGVSTTQACAL